LLAAHALHGPAAPPRLGFTGTAPDGSIQVSQQSGTATVTLSRTEPTGALQVRVTTLPSPAVGVNVAPVDQTVTFNPGQTQASVSVPIIAGAPNAREVDAVLSLTPINPPPNLVNAGQVELRVMANSDLIPPTIVAARRTPAGVALTFSKPMDPARVTNVANYALHATTTQKSDTKDILGAVFLGKWSGLGTTTYSGQVRLRTATYDPATRTVTLIPARHLDASAQLTVTSALQSRRRVRPRAHTAPVQPLTDLAGNAVAGNLGPGAFWVPVSPGRAG
jgi:hypothetical protein